jgi:hypothetical protein
MHVIYMLFICGLQIQIFNLSWTNMQLQHIASFMTKLDKSITS